MALLSLLAEGYAPWTLDGEFGGEHKLYCIDKGGLAIWGIADDGDQYEMHSPSTMRIPLSQREQEYISGEF